MNNPASPSKKPVRFTLELTEELNEHLEQLATQAGGTKSDVLRKGIALYEVALRARAEGKPFGIGRPGQDLQTEIIGL